MTTETHLLEKYGPLLSLEQLASLFDRSTDGLRLTLRDCGNDLSQRVNPARRKIGRRVYFKSSLIAAVIDQLV